MFLVIEIQKTGNTIANIANAYETMAEADNKYYTILAAAAVSNVPKHGAVLLDENCYCIRNDHYEHEVSE